ncbi:hypothetical protein SUGI_1067020 [Cryptomeria japonica]|uniref:presenilin-like protein At2g29900 n=1 Tax=Cryptomeria japonica TaxID=3369 RepID=UPI002414BF40|nr:presenilin-like protein At2g29900 [Cryptomeria japonica]GLJ50147.1 hypothetical protein SUGI_1067020 [Cryptomeria japonica]
MFQHGWNRFLQACSEISGGSSLVKLLKRNCKTHGMDDSILEIVGAEIIGITVPVSICMLLVVLLVRSINPQGESVSSIQTAATLVYQEKSSDSTTEKFEGALLNAAVFVVLITGVTFLLVLLYYYRCMRFLKGYMCFSAFLVLAYMGGSIFIKIIQSWSIPIDIISFSIFLFNFTVVGVLAVFSEGIPIVITQSYMVMLGISVAYWFSMLPEWTTWVLLVALAVYDLVAVLAPGGPLNLLVDLASRRDEQLPALIYEAQPAVVRRRRSSSSPQHGSIRSSLHFSGEQEQFSTRHGRSEALITPSMELQPWNSSSQTRSHIQAPTQETTPRQTLNVENGNSEVLTLISNVHQAIFSSSEDGFDNEFSTVPVTESSSFPEISPAEETFDRENNMIDEESIPLVNHTNGSEVMTENGAIDEVDMIGVTTGGAEERVLISASRGIKLGLGDFVFYSVLVGRAAMYDLLTVYACYLAIISGLGCTLGLLAVYRRALPALPISISLGVMFYFLTRLLMEPLVVGLSTNLMMF